MPLTLVALLVAACSGTGTGPSSAPSASFAAPEFGTHGESDYPFPSSAELPADSASLVGPHYSLQIDKITFTDRFTREQASTFQHGLTSLGPMRAAPGHRFMVVHTTEPAVKPGLMVDRNWVPANDSVRAVIRIGRTSLPLPIEFSRLLTDQTFVMSVPATGHPLLTVTDSGRTQSLDLETGKRARDAISGYYPIPTGDGLDFHVPCTAGPITPCALSVGAQRATLQPYLPGKGWARKGRAWLYFKGTATAVSAPPDPSKPGFGYTLDPAASFTLDTPGGGTIRGRGKVAAGPADQSGAGGRADMHVYFEVPTTFRTGVLRLNPQGKFTLNNRPTPWTPTRPAKPIKITLRP